MFKRLIDFISAYRAQTRALERIRAERASIERTNAELKSVSKRNADAEAALRELAKFSVGEAHRNASAMEEAEKTAEDITDRLGKVSEATMREAFDAQRALAESWGGSEKRAEAFVKSIAGGGDGTGESESESK